MINKQTSAYISSLASRCLRGERLTVKEQKALAACCLVQDQTPGQAPRKRRAKATKRAPKARKRPSKVVSS
jgi:hypothetical protein